MLVNDLPELEDIIDNISPTELTFYNEEEYMEIYETCIHIMEEFINQNPKIISEADFDDIFDDNINELMHSHFDYDIFYTEEAQEEMEDIILHAKNDFFKFVIPPRSYDSSIIINIPNYEVIKTQIDYLRSKPQPKQRTKEWYEFRRNLITASNAYKAFENDAVRNQLIYEKCNSSLDVEVDVDVDVDVEEIKKITINKMVNVNTTLHWGQKYEPVSVKIYESMFNTNVEDFGCIQDDNYRFLGASPDGINVNKLSPRYGRMLEIKNIVNREIDGIPKKEYWIQMQLQMYVCKLNECDFLETKFIEYETASDYWNDNSDKRKGIIMYFHTKEGSPYYEYMPFDIVTYENVNNWQESIINKYECEPYNYTWIKDYYWKLEKLSCVLVLRNNKWFEDNIHELVEIWDIIEKERISGYEHRCPKRRLKKDNDIKDKDNQLTNKCLLLPNKINNNSNSKIIYIDTTNIL
jgi:putative phage-type endonuclease